MCYSVWCVSIEDPALIVSKETAADEATGKVRKKWANSGGALSARQIDLSPPLHLRTSVNPGRKLPLGWGTTNQSDPSPLVSREEKAKRASLSPREEFNSSNVFYRHKSFFFHEVSWYVLPSYGEEE